MLIVNKCVSCNGETLHEDDCFVCEKCGLRMASDMHTLDYDLSYTKDDSLYGEHIKHLNRFQSTRNPLEHLIPFESRIVEFLQNDSGLKSIADLGCGTGRFLRAAEHIGLNAIGFEIASILVKELQKHGRDVKQGGINEFISSNIKSDVITLLEVVEHLAEPRKSISSILNLKHPKLVFVVVPEWKTRRHFDSNFASHDVPPNHLTWWSKQSLGELLAHPDYEVHVEEVAESRRSLLGHIFRNEHNSMEVGFFEWVRALLSPPPFWLLGIAYRK